jgi:hypothetical protein
MYNEQMRLNGEQIRLYSEHERLYTVQREEVAEIGMPGRLYQCIMIRIRCRESWTSYK